MKLNIKPRNIVTFVATTVATVGVSTIVKEVVKHNVAPESTYAKVGVAVGTYAIVSIVSLHTKKYVDDQLDSAFDAAAAIKAKVNEAQEVQTTEV